jgi:hypothetical protein
MVKGTLDLLFPLESFHLLGEEEVSRVGGEY